MWRGFGGFADSRDTYHVAPERKEDDGKNANEAADEFDESSTAVTERRDLSTDVKKRLQNKEELRKFLEKRMPPDSKS